MSFDPTIEGWFTEEDANNYGALALMANSQADTLGTAIEVGTWAGRSLFSIVGIPQRIICVDTWRGSPEHQNGAQELGDIYERFLFNLAKKNLLGDVTPIRMKSVDAAFLLDRAGVKADLVFIDACHDAGSVWSDIVAWRRIVRPGGILAGHDYNANWPGVVSSVDQLIPDAVKPSGDSSIWHTVL